MDNSGPLHDCPNCGEAMLLAQVTPKFGPHPDLFTFKCDGCGEVATTLGEGDCDVGSY